MLTQGLVLQPRAEANLAVRQVRELGPGRGINDIELGLRLRYEIVPELTPYVGVLWKRQFGGTADFTRDEGEEVGTLSVIADLCFWL